MRSFLWKLDNFFPVERRLKKTIRKAYPDTHMKPIKPFNRTKRVVNILNDEPSLFINFCAVTLSNAKFKFNLEDKT